MATRRTKLWLVVLAFLLIAAAAGLRTDLGTSTANYLFARIRGGYTVGERVRMYGEPVAIRLRPAFEAVSVPYPPHELAYLAFKDTRRLEVYARADPSETWRQVRVYPILGMSGGLGPKLRQGDKQVPEGIYRAEFLNPNSRFHLSIRLNFPNAFDKARAMADGRAQLGSDIMIHGTSASIGCLAMGNQAAEDLFILAAITGKERVEIVIAPTDFRTQPTRIPNEAPRWLPPLYDLIKLELGRFPAFTGASA